MAESKDRKDERLAVAVEKYPVIYDKAHPDHKRKDVQDNAWKGVAFVSFLMVSFFCLQSMPQWRLPAEDVYHALFCVYMLPS